MLGRSLSLLLLLTCTWPCFAHADDEVGAPPPSEVLPPESSAVEAYRQQVLVLDSSGGKLRVRRGIDGPVLSSSSLEHVLGSPAAYAEARQRRWLKYSVYATGGLLAAGGLYWWFFGELDQCILLQPGAMKDCLANAADNRHRIGGVMVLAGGVIGLLAYTMDDRPPSDGDVELLVRRYNSRLRRKLGVGAIELSGLWWSPVVTAGGGGLALGGQF